MSSGQYQYRVVPCLSSPAIPCLKTSYFNVGTTGQETLCRAFNNIGKKSTYTHLRARIEKLGQICPACPQEEKMSEKTLEQQLIKAVKALGVGLSNW